MKTVYFHAPDKPQTIILKKVMIPTDNRAQAIH